MGSHRDGFHHRLPFVAEEEQCHLCRHRQPLKRCPLLSSEGLHFSSSVGVFVYRTSCTTFPRRSALIEAAFHLQLLVGRPKGDSYDNVVQYRLSPSDQWAG